MAVGRALGVRVVQGVQKAQYRRDVNGRKKRRPPAISCSRRLDHYHRAPLVGEHNYEIYHDELRLTNGEMVSLKQAGVI